MTWGFSTVSHIAWPDYRFASSFVNVKLIENGGKTKVTGLASEVEPAPFISLMIFARRTGVASLKRFINPKRLMHKLLKLPCSLRDATSNLACGLSSVVGIKRRAENSLRLIITSPWCPSTNCSKKSVKRPKWIFDLNFAIVPSQKNISSFSR